MELLGWPNNFSQVAHNKLIHEPGFILKKNQTEVWFLSFRGTDQLSYGDFFRLLNIELFQILFKIIA